jgi:hypothetical protein
VKYGTSDLGVVLAEVIAFVDPPARPRDGNANIVRCKLVFCIIFSVVLFFTPRKDGTVPADCIYLADVVGKPMTRLIIEYILIYSLRRNKLR